MLFGVHGGGQPISQLDFLVDEIQIGIWDVAQSWIC